MNNEEVKEKNLGGRPRIEIDREQFEKLCELQCTLIEISNYFDCSEDKIEMWCKEEYNKGFSEVFRQKRGKGKVSLRRTQWQLAETSVPMAIFLGKQYLGQKDKVEFEDNRKDDEAFDELTTEELKKLAGE
jgi:hypothetical protein